MYCRIPKSLVFTIQRNHHKGFKDLQHNKKEEGLVHTRLQIITIRQSTKIDEGLFQLCSELQDVLKTTKKSFYAETTNTKSGLLQTL